LSGGIGGNPHGQERECDDPTNCHVGSSLDRFAEKSFTVFTACDRLPLEWKSLIDPAIIDESIIFRPEVLALPLLS